MKGYVVTIVKETCIFDGPNNESEKNYYTLSCEKATNKFNEWKQPYKNCYQISDESLIEDSAVCFCVEKELNDWDVQYISISIKEIEIEE